MCLIVLLHSNYFAADTWAAVWIAVMTCGTMFPMSVYSGKILLQVRNISLCAILLVIHMAFGHIPLKF